MKTAIVGESSYMEEGKSCERRCPTAPLPGASLTCQPQSLTSNLQHLTSRPRDVKKGAGTISSYVYDQAGNRTRVNYGNGTYQTYTYNPTDPRYQFDKIDYAYRCGTGQPVAVQGSIGLTRDDSGNPLTWSALDMSTPQKKIYSKAYSYDQMYRLNSANYPGKGTTDFQYDWVGNRTNPNAMEYNASDQLTRWRGQHRYEYDARGNLIYEKSDSGTLQKTYAYTYSNLTSSISYAGVSRASLMTWDAAGNRITFQSSTRANDSDTYTFVYDPTAGIPAVVEETSQVGATGTTTRYIREPGGELVARVATVGATETTHYYHFDELGSTQFLTDTNGVITDKYTYDAWGNLTSHTGSTQQPYQYVGKYGYYTHGQDNNLKMMQLGVRLYDAETGRFVQRDPLAIDAIADTLYADARPTLLLDPDGRKCRSARTTDGEGFSQGKCLNRLKNCLRGDPLYNKIFSRFSDSLWPHMPIHIYVCDKAGDIDSDPFTLGLTRNRAFWWSIFLIDTGTKSDMCEVLLHELVHVTGGYYGFMNNEDLAYKYGDVESSKSIYKKRCQPCK